MFFQSEPCPTLFKSMTIVMPKWEGPTSFAFSITNSPQRSSPNHIGKKATFVIFGVWHTKLIASQSYLEKIPVDFTSFALANYPGASCRLIEMLCITLTTLSLSSN